MHKMFRYPKASASETEKCSPDKVFFSFCATKKNSMKKHDTAATADEIFRYQFSLKHRRFTLRYFATACQKNFAKKRATHPLHSLLSIYLFHIPFLCIERLEIQNILGHRSVPQRVLSAR